MAAAPDVKERLCGRWPGRREQISQLLGLIGEPHDHAMPVFVHGPPVTGKTGIVRDVLGTLGRPFAYTSLVDSHGLRLLLDALVEELAPRLTGLEDKDLKCDRLTDLVAILRKGLPRGNPAVYLVIDEATRLLDWKGSESLLPALMKLAELTERNVGCILIATPGWDAFRTASGARPPRARVLRRVHKGATATGASSRETNRRRRPLVRKLRRIDSAHVRRDV